MVRINLWDQITNFVVFVVFQILLLNRLVLFENAFAFFYVGFILFLPRTLGMGYQLIIAFLVGLLIDVFSNTPGMHAGITLFIAYVKGFWMDIINEESREFNLVNIYTLKLFGLLGYMVPLILIHHLLLFIIENGGFHLFGQLVNKSIASTLFSSVLILVIGYLIARKA
jgi:hypothetical protein